jgi:N-methylhydantoinase A
VRETVIRRYLAMRYKGQTREVLVPIRSRTRRVTAINLKSALQEFHAIHEELYSFKQPEHPTEVVDLRLELTGVRDALRIRSEPLGDEDATAARTGTRAVYFHGHGGFVDTPVYAGMRIAPGQLVQGPAVIEEPTTTLVVYPDQEAMADQYRTYVVELQV